MFIICTVAVIVRTEKASIPSFVSRVLQGRTLGLAFHFRIQYFVQQVDITNVSRSLDN